MSTNPNVAVPIGIRITKVERINAAILPQGRKQEQIHPCNELLCLLRGGYEVVLANGCRHRGGPGCAFVYPAGLAHLGRWATATGIDFLLVWWEGALPIAPMPVRANLPPERLHQWCSWMLDAWATADGHPVAGHLLTALLLDLAHRRDVRDDLVQVVDALIDQTQDRRLRVADLAAAAGLSRYHFSRRFKALTGMSPMAYSRRRRLAGARRDLVETDDPIADIARRHLFATPQQMATLMRKRYGASPTDVRRAAGYV